jgi:hypothetical protein
MSNARIQELVALANSKTLTEEEEEKLSVKLVAEGHPGYGVTSVDGADYYPPYTIYKSIFFFNKYKQSQDRSMLDQACEWGLFKALVKRCDINTDIMIGNDESAKAAAYVELVVDLAQLGHLYWSVGFIHAARIYLDIANHYDQKHKAEYGDESSEEGYLPMAAAYHDEAARNYHRARFLFSQPQSQNVSVVVYREKGLRACGWDSVELAEKDILSHVEETRNSAILKEVQLEIKATLNKNPSVVIRH